MRKFLLVLALTIFAISSSLQVSAKGITASRSAKTSMTIPAPLMPSSISAFDDNPASRSQSGNDVRPNLQFTELSLSSSPLVRGKINVMDITVTNLSTDAFNGTLSIGFLLNDNKHLWTYDIEQGRNIDIPAGGQFSTTAVTDFSTLTREDCGTCKMCLYAGKSLVSGKPNSHEITIAYGEALTPDFDNIHLSVDSVAPEIMTKGENNVMSITLTNESDTDYFAPILMAFLMKNGEWWQDYLDRGQSIYIPAGKSIEITYASTFSDVPDDELGICMFQFYMVSHDYSELYPFTGYYYGWGCTIWNGSDPWIESMEWNPNPMLNGMDNSVTLTLTNRGTAALNTPLVFMMDRMNGAEYIDTPVNVDLGNITIEKGASETVEFNVDLSDLSAHPDGLYKGYVYMPAVEGVLTSVTQKEDNGTLFDIRISTLSKDGELGYAVSGNDEVTVMSGEEFNGGVIPSTVTIDDKEYTVTAIADGAFAGNSTIKSVNIPATVVTIGDKSFLDCTALEEVTIYAAVEPAGRAADQTISVGSNAFGGCTALMKVRCLSIVPPVCAIDAFSDNTYANGVLIVPDGAIDSYSEAEGWNRFKKITDPTTLGIENVESDHLNGVSGTYDLNGRKVSITGQGVYIVDGKKVLITK